MACSLGWLLSTKTWIQQTESDGQVAQRECLYCRETQADHTGQWQAQSPQTREKEIPWPGKTLTLFPMLKAFLVSGAVVSAAAALASPASAGTYANVENNASYQDGFQGSTTDIHIGYEGGDGIYGFYLQGGPAITSDGSDSDMELSGKIGGSVQASPNVSIYGELSFITAEDDPSVGTKLGAKWNF